MNPAFVIDTLLEASARAVLIAGLVAMALAAFRAKAPGLRHGVWTAALVTMMALPVMSGWMPTLQVPLRLPRPTMKRVVAAIPAASVVYHLIPPSPTTPSSSSDAQSKVGLSPMPSGPVPIRQLTAFTATSPRGDWRLNAVFLWFVVAVVMLLREAVGWRFARRLAAQGIPAQVGDGTYESERVMTPVVTGVLRPRVLVPSSWSQWGNGVRGMVLAHERAHVDRRDPLVAALARVNRSIFWFHPLAWWLERHLSRLAERACDEVVVRELKDSKLYAALLVEMAHRIQQQGRRVAWQGIGIVSSRSFEERLDRILDGPAPPSSRRATAALATACVVLMIVAVACGTAAAPLAEDPELAKKIAASRTTFANYEAAIAMNLEKAAELEKVVANNPDDLNATAKLLTFYLSKGQKLMGWSQMMAARRAVVLRVIERHPESLLVIWRTSRRLDPEGYEKARVLWQTHANRPDVSPDVLSQAATFFERVEKPLAEQLLLRAQVMDPTGPPSPVSVAGVGLYRPPWSRRLGTLYAMAIAGSHDQTEFDDVTNVDAAQMQSTFAMQARQKLDQSNDAALLLGAGNFLITHAKAKLDYDPVALGTEYVAKASKFDATSAEAMRILAQPEHNRKYEEMLQRFGQGQTLDDAAFDRLPVSSKLEYAEHFLGSPYGQMMEAYWKKDQRIVEAAFATLKNRANTIQRLIETTQPSALPAGLQSDVHVAFGTSAMHLGNRREAVRRLGLAASTTAARPTENLGIGLAAEKLAHDLLDAGERESVATFYERVARQFAGHWKSTYEQAAAAIRAGKMPASYQRTLAARANSGTFYVR